MKKILYFAVTILIATGFVACNDDEDDVRLSSSPQVESAGKYTGKWTVKITQTIDNGDGKIEKNTLYDNECDGSITLSAYGSYVSEATFQGNVLEQYMSDALTGKYNIAQTNNGFTIYNFHQIIDTHIEEDIEVDGVPDAFNTTNNITDKIVFGGGEISLSNDFVLNGYSRTKQEIIGYSYIYENPKTHRKSTLTATRQKTTDYKLSFKGTKE